MSWPVSTRSVRQSTGTAPGDVPRPEQASGAAIRTPSGIEHPQLGPAEVLGEPLGGGQELGPSQATHRGYHRAVVAPFLPDAEKLTAIREAIPALSAGIYLNTGSVGPLPAETAAAMSEMAIRERDVGRAHPDDIPEMFARMAEARAGVAAVLGTGVEAVALTHSTSDGMNAATMLPDWRSGGRAVTTRLEHPGGIGPLYALRDRAAIDLVLVDAGDDGDDARTIAAFDEAITPGTRLVSLSHVAWTTGAVLPVAAIAEIAHARGALVVVDGAQAAGAIPFRFEDLGADLYALPAQKWLLGPEGMGALVVAPSVVERFIPALAGYFSFERVDGAGLAELVARRPSVRGDGLPSPVGGRDGPIDRLAVDVRRARIRLPAWDWQPRRRRRPGWLPSRV